MKRRDYLAATAAATTIAISGCSDDSSSIDTGPSDEVKEELQDEKELKETFNSAAANQDGFLHITNIQMNEDVMFVDFVPAMETNEERAEMMGKLIGVYRGVIESGEDLPIMIGYAMDEVGGESIWSFTVERSWVDEWMNEEIEGTTVVERAAETYEEHSSQGD